MPGTEIAGAEILEPSSAPWLRGRFQEALDLGEGGTFQARVPGMGLLLEWEDHIVIQNSSLEMLRVSLGLSSRTRFGNLGTGKEGAVIARVCVREQFCT